MSSPKAQSRKKLGTRRKALFTLIALLVACTPLLVLEAVLYLSGWQEKEQNMSEVRDPFIGFSGEQTLFEKTPDGLRYRIRQSRLGYFRPASFLVEKPENGYRVFVLGGSTVQGRPWETETAFAKWLELGLAAGEAKSTFEVINCGGVSYASYRLSRIMDELVEYSPDLIILCTGHNEFLEKRTYQVENNLPNFVVQIHQWMSLSRSYRWARSNVLGIRNPNPDVPEVGEKVITRLDYRDGLDLFDEKTLQRESVASHFEFNLQRMVSTALGNGTRILILAPPSNLKDCFPFKPRSDWSPGDKSRFRTLSLAELQAESTQETSADYFYFRGQRNLESGNFQQAQLDFERALDNDICPIRMTSSLRRKLEKVVSSAKQKFGEELVLHLDLQERCEAESKHRIVGDDLLVDHVHPSVGTNKKIAMWILDLLHEKQLIHRRPDWRPRYEKLVAEHQASLDFGYFQRGKERLESVLKWSRGRAINPIDDNPIEKQDKR